MATKQQKGLGLAAAVAGIVYLATRKGGEGGGAYGGGTSGSGAGVGGFDPYQPTQPGKPGGTGATPPGSVGGLSGGSTSSTPPGSVGGIAGPGSDPGAGGVVSTIPIPGQLYRIQLGDTLLGVAGKAYNLPSGSARLSASIAINDDDWNRANGTYVPTVLQEAEWYGPERLSFGLPFQVINIPEGY